MKKNPIILATLAVIAGLLAPVCGADALERMYLEQISVAEGMPHTDVNAIAGDPEGFLWFGTFSGLCRYDGRRMEVFNVTNSMLESSRIKSLHVSDDGLLYVGTETGGLSVYDTAGDRFLMTVPVPLNNVNRIFSYKGKICLCTDAGVSFVEFSDGNYVMESYSLGSGVMGGCPIPGKGLALCTPSGLFLASESTGGGYSFRKVLPGIYCCEAVLPDGPDELLLAGYDGCFKVDTRDWSAEKLDGREALSLYKAADGKIWVGTRKDGMLCYDKELNLLHDSGPDRKYGFNSCDITSFYMDGSSVLWIGTIGNGCYKKIRHTDDFRLYSITGSAGNDHIICMYADSRDRLWISTRDGALYVMCGEQVTRLDERSLSVFGGMPVSFIYEDDLGSIWFGAWTHGPHVISGKNLDRAVAGLPFGFSGFPGHPLLNAASIYMADTDDSGNIWFSTNYGVFRYEGSSDRISGRPDRYAGKWTCFTSDPADSSSLTDNFCTDIFAETYDGRRYVWVGSRLGLTRFICSSEGDVQSISRIYPSRSENGLSGDYISVIHRDREDSLWIATLGGGLNKLSGDRSAPELHFRHYDSEDFPFGTCEFESLQEDSSGVFWIGSARGLVRFDPGSGQVKTFSKKDGLQSDVFKIWASTAFSDGRMAFGGPEGFNIFDPSGISRNEIPPVTVLTGLRINGRDVMPGDTVGGKVVLSGPLRHSRSITLPHDCNSLAFRFAALHYEHPEMNSFRFRLEGLDNIWHYSSDSNASASYLNLKPGRYAFTVYGANSDGIWGTVPARLAVTIRPPLWKSTAACIIYLLSAMGLLFFLKTVIQRRNRQHYELEMERKLRMEEAQRNENEMKFHTDFLHEIKTPLTLISAPVDELLENHSLGKTTRERLQLVRRSAMILQKLLDTVTDFRKYDNGKSRLHVTEVDFCRFVDESVRLFVPYMKNRGISFSAELPQTPVMLFIDRMEMEKVLMNLMSNAIRYSPETGGRISVSVTTDNSAGSAPVLLSVSNTGMGILPEDIDRIFDRFRQGSNNTSRKGMGIGLAISKHVVELHGGEIYAESVPGQKTVFHVRLRTGCSHFREEDIDRNVRDSDGISGYEDISDVMAGLASRLPQASGRTYTVLVADDSPDLRSYLGQLLSLRYNVIIASAGREAYEKAIADQPDVIISDVIMPGMDGMELCSAIKKNPDTSHIPVILLSARSLPVDKVEGFDALADEYMTKPFQSEVLLSRIANLIRQRESMRDAFRKNIVLEPSSVSGTTSDERFMKNVISVIEEHVSEPEFGVDELCEEIGVSRPALYRKIKSLTGLSAIRFLRSIRLKRAAQLLASDENMSVSSVMYATGFSNMSYFSRIFFDEFHVLPKDWYGRSHASDGSLPG